MVASTHENLHQAQHLEKNTTVPDESSNHTIADDAQAELTLSKKAQFQEKLVDVMKDNGDLPAAPKAHVKEEKVFVEKRPMEYCLVRVYEPMIRSNKTNS